MRGGADVKTPGSNPTSAARFCLSLLTRQASAAARTPVLASLCCGGKMGRKKESQRGQCRTSRLLEHRLGCYGEPGGRAHLLPAPGHPAPSSLPPSGPGAHVGCSVPGPAGLPAGPSLGRGGEGPSAPGAQHGRRKPEAPGSRRPERVEETPGTGGRQPATRGPADESVRVALTPRLWEPENQFPFSFQPLGFVVLGFASKELLIFPRGEEVGRRWRQMSRCGQGWPLGTTASARWGHSLRDMRMITTWPWDELEGEVPGRSPAASPGLGREAGGPGSTGSPAASEEPEQQAGPTPCRGGGGGSPVPGGPQGARTAAERGQVEAQGVRTGGQGRPGVTGPRPRLPLMQDLLF